VPAHDPSIRAEEDYPRTPDARCLPIPPGEYEFFIRGRFRSPGDPKEELEETKMRLRDLELRILPVPE
jgi:hypothetical protein